MMNLNASTHLLIILRPENEEHVLALVVYDILSGSEASCIETGEKPERLDIAMLFPLVNAEKLISLAISRPLALPQINALAGLVAAGGISGFIVRGNIDPGRHVIHSQQPFLDEQIETSKARESQSVPDEQKQDRPLTERARYQLAVDTGTTEYYDAALRREAFRHDE